MLIRTMTLITGVLLFTSLSCGKAADATVPIDPNKQKDQESVATKEKFGMPFEKENK